MNTKSNFGQQRITVAEAIRRLSEFITSQDDSKFPDERMLFGATTLREEGTGRVFISEASKQSHASFPKEGWEGTIPGKQLTIGRLRQSFSDFCKATGTTPRNMHNPWTTDPYIGGAQELKYDISIDEFRQWAAPYGAQHLADLPTSIEESTTAIPTALPLENPTACASSEMRSPMRRIKPQSGDSLTPMIWEICYELSDAGEKVTPAPVMTELKLRADSEDPKLKGPLLCSVTGGVKYEQHLRGDEKELDSPKLQARINEWKKANGLIQS